MSRRAFTFASTFFLVATNGPLVKAQEVTLRGRGGDVVFVWKDKESADEAASLIAAGVQNSNPMLVYRLMACMPEAGTKAIITSSGWLTDDIEVIEGEYAGCRGNVPVEYVQ